MILSKHTLKLKIHLLYRRYCAFVQKATKRAARTASFHGTFLNGSMPLKLINLALSEKSSLS